MKKLNDCGWKHSELNLLKSKVQQFRLHLKFLTWIDLEIWNFLAADVRQTPLEGKSRNTGRIKLFVGQVFHHPPVVSVTQEDQRYSMTKSRFQKDPLSTAILLQAQ